MSLFQSAADWVGGEWKTHWKIITAVAAGTVVAVVVTAVIIGSFGTAVPVLLAAAGASGALSAATTQGVDDVLENKRPGLDVVESAAIGGTVSMATFGAGRVLAPMVPESVAAFLPGKVPDVEGGAAVVETALKKAIPWGQIPRVVFNQTLPQLMQEAEVGIVGALSGHSKPKDTAPALVTPVPPPPTPVAPRAPPATVANTIANQPLGD
jgi:hypothetical protein